MKGFGHLVISGLLGAFRGRVEGRLWQKQAVVRVARGCATATLSGDLAS